MDPRTVAIYISFMVVITAVFVLVHYLQKVMPEVDPEEARRNHRFWFTASCDPNAKKLFGKDKS